MNSLKPNPLTPRFLRRHFLEVCKRAAALSVSGFIGVTSLAVNTAHAQGTPAPNASGQIAVFAGGCFWCTESDFDKVPGVISTTSGYIGGTTANPTYEQVSSKNTGHAEAVSVVFDPKKVSYEQLLSVYWRSIDPTTKNAQFCDRGSAYRSAIFALNEQQLELANKSLADLEKTKPFKQPIVTEIVLAPPAKLPFYQAEEYHQNYHTKNPVRYKYYRTSCGRDARLKQLWGGS
jgi:peptide-methionine (S)-S-oxide reductase